MVLFVAKHFVRLRGIAGDCADGFGILSCSHEQVNLSLESYEQRAQPVAQSELQQHGEDWGGRRGLDRDIRPGHIVHRGTLTASGGGVIGATTTNRRTCRHPGRFRGRSHERGTLEAFDGATVSWIEPSTTPATLCWRSGR